MFLRNLLRSRVFIKPPPATLIPSTSAQAWRSQQSQSQQKQAKSDTDVIEPEAYSVVERRKFVADQIAKTVDDKTRRLFAVVYIHSKQFKVSQDDIIHLEKNIPLDVGDEIKFEKVLLVGGTDFTLIGRPMLNPRHVHVYATVIEKTTTSPDVEYNEWDNVKYPKWLSTELTVLRINEIAVDKEACLT